jgi:small nuclear ribonucleoprotein (snRNP)-like protein
MFKNKEVIVKLKDKKIYGTFIRIDLEKNLFIRNKSKIERVECKHIINIKQYE